MAIDDVSPALGRERDRSSSWILHHFRFTAHSARGIYPGPAVKASRAKRAMCDSSARGEPGWYR